jgi:Secretion system C-terminal sorting domain
MKTKSISYIISFILFILSPACYCQLENVYVETYYVTDENDATDSTGGYIQANTTTYRIYLDLAPGTTVTEIFGDAEHPFEIKSSEPFYNHSTDGQSFAKDFLKARYQESTVALDTWLTIGQTTKKQGEITHFGLPKRQDTNGSFIGGINNDGGSELIPEGLLNNQNLAYPLTIADGMDTLNYTPNEWFSTGVVDFFNGLDTTIFGSSLDDTSFVSTNFTLSCSGVQGVLPDSNMVLIAQLTTKGELEFKINFRATYLVDGVLTTTTYIGTNSIISDDQVYSSFLSYPLICGCTNPQYIEFSPAFSCSDSTACQNPVYYGCMDTLACNYDSLANYNIPELCCYPGWCADRNIENVCPHLMGNRDKLSIYPNPASDRLTVEFISGSASTSIITITNIHGYETYRFDQNEHLEYFARSIPLTDWSPGIYQVKVQTDQSLTSKLFVIL